MAATLWILALAAFAQTPPRIAVPDPPGLRPAVVAPPLGIPDPPGLSLPPSPSLPSSVPVQPPPPYLPPSSPVQPDVPNSPSQPRVHPGGAWQPYSYGHSYAPTAPVVAEPANYSWRLKAELRGEYLYIIQNQQKVNFWGARIVAMDPDSPLDGLGLSVGDVITRLDGARISEGMTLVRDRVTGKGYYKLPELDRHHSAAELRYIKAGTHEVKIGRVDLGPPSARAPVTR